MLRISDRSLEGSYQVSHPLKFPLFLVRSEMESLLAALGQPLIAQTSKLVSEDEIYVSVEAFLDAYERYITGKMEADDRAILSSVMTKNCDALYAMQQSDGRYLVRPCLPVMQLHLFHFTLSHDKKECISMAHGKGAIPWGVEFFFPSRFRDPHTFKDSDVLKDERFENKELCKTMQKWVRQNTMPTPLLIDDARKNQTFRIGKKKLSTINSYGPLVECGLKVAVLHD